MELKVAALLNSLFEKFDSRKLTTPEDIMSHNMSIWLRNRVLDEARLVFFHVPNEACIPHSYGKKLNAIGRISGAPDFVVASDNRVIFLELKAGNNKMTENQKAFEAWASYAGVPYFCTNSLSEAHSIVNEYVICSTPEKFSHK